MNDDLKNQISNLSLQELENVKTLVNTLLDTKANKKQTNIEFLQENKIIVCPKNRDHRIKRNGLKNGIQRFWCHGCKHGFSLTNNSITNSSSISYSQIKTLLKCMYDYKSVKEIAFETGLHKTSVFELEIRIFDALEQVSNNLKLKEVVQIDEKYIRTSFKGTRAKNMPRPSRYNGNSDLISGISEDQVCIVVAIDTYDTIIIKVVGNGNASTDMISKALKNKIEEGSVIVTDCKNSYEKFAENNKLKLIQIPSKKHKIDDYTINDVNEIMNEIEIYLKQKRGISTRHLQHHMNFIRYKKIIKYTIEYMEINKKMYIDVITLKTRIKSNDVYSTEQPIDIDDYKKWYEQHH